MHLTEALGTKRRRLGFTKPNPTVIGRARPAPGWNPVVHANAYDWTARLLAAAARRVRDGLSRFDELRQEAARTTILHAFNLERARWRRSARPLLDERVAEDGLTVWLANLAPRYRYFSANSTCASVWIKVRNRAPSPRAQRKLEQLTPGIWLPAPMC
jgi:hypothetical protein